jgi:hypothetical protein
MTGEFAESLRMTSIFKSSFYFDLVRYLSSHCKRAVPDQSRPAIAVVVIDYYTHSFVAGNWSPMTTIYRAHTINYH